MPGYRPRGRHDMRRKAKLFDAALNHFSSGLNQSDRAAGRAKVTDPQIRELVRTAEALTRAASHEPDPQFAAGLRTALMSEADSVLRAEPVDSAPAPQPAPARRPARRRLAAAVAAALIVATGGGAIASSTQAMPGDILYPVKLQVESAQSGLHFSEVSKGGYELDLASKRLDEASALIGQDADPELISATLERFTSEAGDGAARLFAAHKPNANEQPVEVVQEFAESADKKLSALRTAIPAQASQAYREAVATLRSLSNQVSTLCADCDHDSISSIRSSVSDRAKSDRAKDKPADSPDDSSSGSQHSSGQKPGNRHADKHSGPKSTSSDHRGSGTDSSGGKRQQDSPETGGRRAPAPSPEPSSPGLLDPVTGLLSDLLG